MQILVATFDAWSHVTQAVPLVQRLVQRGHIVRWLVHPRFKVLVERSGATLLRPQAMPSHRDIGGMRLSEWVAMFHREAMAQAADLTAALEDAPTDVLLIDPTFPGMRAVTPGYPDCLPVLFGCVPLLHIPAECELVLQASLPSMELPVPPQHQSRVAFVGPLLPAPTPDLPPPPDLDPTKPLVIVTQGTLASDPTLLIDVACAALADVDVQVLATCQPRPVPANARCVPWLSFAHVLPKAACVVSGAGFATAQWCSAAGIPLVQAGDTEDKPEVARRIAWAGIGVSIVGKPTTDATLREAVWEVTQNPRYRAEAARHAMQCAWQDSPTLACQILEATRRQSVPLTEDAHAAA